jgi:N-acetylneuraminic acid mutarotase
MMIKHIQITALAICWCCIAMGQENTWRNMEQETKPQKRSECSFVECDGKFYALGGRGSRPVEEYDPATGKWSLVAQAPREFHHLQAISFRHEIYVIGALTGNYPHEIPLDRFLIFNPKTRQWREGPLMPENRRRGSAGVFSKGNKIYIVGGIVDGHWDGFVGWFDAYDTKTGKWEVLPDMPHPRDHFQAALMGDKVYAAGGRTSYAKINKVLDLTVPEVDVFDFKNKSWTTLAEPLPTVRAGTASIARAPYLLVLNGESKAQVAAHKEVELLDTRTGKWSRLPDLNRGRHGTGAVYWKGKIYVAAGCGNRGGEPELDDMEVLAW